MDEQDMEFVSKTLQQQFKLVLNEDKFEQIIDRLEKESAKLVRAYFRNESFFEIDMTKTFLFFVNQGKMCDQTVLDQYKLASTKLTNHVYEYWSKKRAKLGKALIRRFQPPTSINDTSPHSTFRPREKEEKRMRRTRMKDKDAHKNLKQFHADFRRAKELLENLVKREKAKKALLQLDFCLKFAKDIKDIPSTVLKQQDDFFKEWHRDRDKAKQSTTKKMAFVEAAEDEPAVANAAGGRPRGAASRPVPAVEAEPVAQPVEEGGDDRARRLEGVKRCFQSLMRNWDGGTDSFGTSLLPLIDSSVNESTRLFTAGSALQSGYPLSASLMQRVSLTHVDSRFNVLDIFDLLKGFKSVGVELY